MRRLKIRNFGPIRAGLKVGDGFIDVTKVTAFIGSQGSGKSSVAKLISTFSWIEKALNRGDFTIKHIEQYRRFKKYFAYQQITDYFRKDTFLEYQGNAYTFKYEDERLTVAAVPNAQFVTPQIMYVPSERNFLSVVENAEKIKSLPDALFTFFEEFDKARNFSSSIELPLGSFSFQYNKQNKTAWVTGDGFRLKLSQAASGFQSYIPLYLVTRFLSQTLGKEKEGYKALSLDQFARFQKEISEIGYGFKSEKYNKLEEIERTKKAIGRYINACFVNIVEEPEQNLFPESQKVLLYELMKSANVVLDNQLILTTHSPYLVNYLSIAAKAYEVYHHVQTEEGKLAVGQIVPIEALIDPVCISIYQLNDNGTIDLLSKVEKIPSDNNLLNNSLRDTNSAIVELMEIEDSVL